MRDNKPLLLAILGGVATFAFTQRKTIMLYGAKALEAGKEALFAQSISSQARPYADIILRVARETKMDPFIIYALGQRETKWGAIIGGPGGKGDGGHGYGIMQIDDRSFAAWLAANPWWDPYTNVRKGADVLAAKMAFFSSRAPVKGLTDGTVVTLGEKAAARRGVSPGRYPDPRPIAGQRLVEAGIAAYNTGEGNVLMSLAAGVSPDTTTASGDAGPYLADVWKKMLSAVTVFGKAA